ncbi:class I SAM-dependent methyltransferase [Puniceicoccus vermicola]|uniref:Class I SAM-dependent methyltransferase n=1 Tax=Puniceicoccus vermicola TaxID=388746 RepID=A0A7X1B2F8_9BACT|nr:class I SAM-dependent methyltransferase [Puniceicoccus vermicola]MBC2604396.1 class I SAM-dependent methyltransferase [Puniceicoccus vermicola]
MNKGDVRKFYNQEDVIDHYAQAASDVGLWISEEKIFQRVFSTEDSILELGCGAGRIAIGLYELGYTKIFATDYARKMVGRARSAAEILEYPIPFGVQDATDLDFADEMFDGAIFGFNGLMQIPGRDGRKKAMSEIFRVLRPGSWFVFTSHDRNASEHPSFWKAETKRWRAGTQDPDLIDFGDRIGATPWGDLYIHVPEANMIRADLKEVGFRIEIDVLRSKLADEPPGVKEFSDECRFWVAQKPEAKE